MLNTEQKTGKKFMILSLEFNDTIINKGKHRNKLDYVTLRRSSVQGCLFYIKEH